MNLTFEDLNDVFHLTVKEGVVKAPHIGYRIHNKILLNRQTYLQWTQALMHDDFHTLKYIVDNVLTFDSYLLSCKAKEDNGLSYSNSEKRIGGG